MGRSPWMFSVIGQVFGTSDVWMDDQDLDNDEEYLSVLINPALKNEEEKEKQNAVSQVIN